MDRTDLPAGRDEESLDIPLHPFVFKRGLGFYDKIFSYYTYDLITIRGGGTDMNVEALKRAAGI